MKKKLFVAAVAAMLVLACVLSFAACTPSLEKLKSTYSDNGYGCLDINVSGVLDNLADVGVEVDGEPSIEYAFVATKLVDNVMVVAFTDSADAKEVYEALGGGESKNVKKKGNAVAIALSLVGESAGLDLF